MLSHIFTPKDLPLAWTPIRVDAGRSWWSEPDRVKWSARQRTAQRRMNDQQAAARPDGAEVGPGVAG